MPVSSLLLLLHLQFLPLSDYLINVVSPRDDSLVVLSVEIQKRAYLKYLILDSIEYVLCWGMGAGGGLQNCD